jgi:hypothetical protein
MNAPADCRDPARELLPWAVTGRLAAADATRVAAHAETCATCRAELEFERRLASHVGTDDNVEYAPSAALQRFQQALDALPERAVPAPEARLAAPVRRFWTPRRVRTAMAVQAAAVLVLAVAVVLRPAPVNEYRTLSLPSAVPARPALRVVFQPDMPVRDLSALLAGLHAEVADGPSEAGVYTVVLAPGADRADALARLRADARVRFAEPVAGSGTPR